MIPRSIPTVPTMVFATLIVLGCALPLAADQTVGLFINDTAAFKGYTLYTPLSYTETYLLDMDGRLVHSWPSDYLPGASVYLLPNGHLMRTCQTALNGGGIIQEIDWDGAVLWNFAYDDSSHRQHHDIDPMPNGNLLVLAREYLTSDEAIAAGRNPATLLGDRIWPEEIIEVRPIWPDSAEIVWRWRLWDHLVQDYDSTRPNYGSVTDHPELVDINWILNTNKDWIHANAVNYNPDLDQIVISSRSLSEFWVIDHSTTTEEAMGHTGGLRGKGGDILYRWGNPQVYDAGDASTRTLIFQHDVQWIKPSLPGEGHLIMFNNGGPPRAYSTIDEIVSPADADGNYPALTPGQAYGPTESFWNYTAETPTDFFSRVISGVQRLPNGNTLICEGTSGRFFEVTSDGRIVWQYKSSVTPTGPVAQGESLASSDVFRCTRYAPDYPGLQGHDLTPGGRIETYPVSIVNASHTPEQPTPADPVYITAFIAADSGLASVQAMADTGDGYLAVAMVDDGAHGDGDAGDGFYGAVLPAISGGIDVSYYVHAEDGIGRLTDDPPNPPTTVYRFSVENAWVCGDIDGSGGSPNIVDLTYFVAYLFNGGPAPAVIAAADVNGGDGSVNILDLTYFVAFLFNGGPASICQ